MSKLMISLSAAPISKDTRVAYKFGKGVWYLGTVTRVSGTKVSILFDDGEKLVEEVNRAKLKVLLKNRKSKQALTDAEVKLLITPASAAKAPVVKAPTSKRGGNNYKC